MMPVLDIAALLLTISAVFGWVNLRYVRLPHAVGVLLMGLAASLALIGLDALFPGEHLHDALSGVVMQVDFTNVVMNGMLAFLLFAGALDVDLGALRDRAWPVAVLSLAGTIISTALVGVGMWLVAGLTSHPLPLPWALVFGALISPTDPVAVLSTLRAVRLPAALEIELQGEALFNDGVGVVLFTLLLGYAMGAGHGTGPAAAAVDLVREAGGGLALGLCTGYVAYRAMRAVDDFPVEVMITLALVAGTYVLAQKLGTSGPLAVVAAGLLIGDRGPRYAMSELTKSYVSGFWKLVDEILNSLLFLLIGLEVLVVRLESVALAGALLAIPVVILARLAAVSAPLLAFPLSRRLSVRNVPLLTWAGVRGGISVALALSLPAVPERPAILAATYAVVVFTIVVQGCTLGAVARRTLGAGQALDRGPASGRTTVV